MQFRHYTHALPCGSSLMSCLTVVIVRHSRQNRSSSRKVCDSEDNWNTAGFPEDNTTTVVGDAKTAGFLRLSAVGFVPGRSLITFAAPAAGISSQRAQESAGHGSGETFVLSAACGSKRAGVDQAMGARASFRSRAR